MSLPNDPAAAAEALREIVETALAETFPDPDSTRLGPFGAARLVESMRYTLETPGKRIRPLLLLASAAAVGFAPEKAIRFAAALEMIHAYSLAHDDLPAMDDDDLRRGQPTNHIVFGAGMATLAGDGLLTEAFVAMTEPVTEPALQARVAREIADAAGWQGMVGGQAADILAEGRTPTEEILVSLNERKTGALLRVSVRAGALLGGASAADLDALTAFAERFGLAFQVADDVKDETAPTEVTGKREGGDRLAQKMTWPALLGVDGARERCRAEMDLALRELAPLGERGALLAHLATESIAPAFAGD